MHRPRWEQHSLALVALSVALGQWEACDLVQSICRHGGAWLLAAGKLGSRWCPGSGFGHMGV
jgi:hypothetical protein